MGKNRVAELLGIRYPILQGGMLWLADAALASAVSNAGGLGVVSPLAGMERHGDRVKNLLTQLARTRDLTTRPFGVNLPLDLAQIGELIDTVVSHEVSVVVTAAGDPRHYSELLKAGGAKVLHVVGSVRQARTAASAGVDGLIVEGVEAGGHNGLEEMPLFSLLPQVADAVSLPIIAAGGIADARGWFAARALGADGVQMGTRFVATEECPASPRYKQAILEAIDTGTVITCRRLVPTRSLRTEFSRKLLDLEQGGASAEAIREFLGYSRPRTGQLEGDLVNGEAYCGASVGLIKEILPAGEIIRRLVQDYQEILNRVNAGSFEI